MADARLSSAASAWVGAVTVLLVASSDFGRWVAIDGVAPAFAGVRRVEGGEAAEDAAGASDAGPAGITDPFSAGSGVPGPT